VIDERTAQWLRGNVVSALSVDVRTNSPMNIDLASVGGDKFGRSGNWVDSVSEENINFAIDPLHASSSRSVKRSSCPLPPNAFFSVQIIRVLNMLPEARGALLRFAYADNCEWSYVELVARSLWQAFLNDQKKKFRAKKERVLKNMVFLAMQNWKYSNLHGSDLHGPSRVIELLEISGHQWRRDWLPFWRQMHSLLSTADRAGLDGIYQGTSEKAYKQCV